MSVRNSLQELVDQILNNDALLSDSGRADLFVIAHHHHVVTHVQCCEGHHVALARFINNDYVKARLCRIKVLDHPREGHDPDRNGVPALRHLMGRLGTQARRTYTGALADLSYSVEPA